MYVISRFEVSGMVEGFWGVENVWGKKTGQFFFRRLEFANKARKFGMGLVEYPLPSV